MDSCPIQPCSSVGNEYEVRAARPQKLFTSPQVVREHGARGRMQRHKPGATELSPPDCEYVLIEVDILDLKIKCLGDAQTGYAEQTKQAMEDPRPQRR